MKQGKVMEDQNGQIEVLCARQGKIKDGGVNVTIFQTAGDTAGQQTDCDSGYQQSGQDEAS